MKGNWLRVMAIAITAQLTYGSITDAQAATEMETGTVVVSATRTEQMIEDVPQTMQVITAKEIEEMGAADMYDILSKAANINISNQKGSISIRGASFSDTLVLINGRKPARMESNHDGLGFILGSIGISNIERIEIIRGQAGVMYGANATAGVVNVITKTSTEEGGMFSIIGGNSEITPSFSYSTGRIGNFDAMFNAQFSQYIPIRENRVNGNQGWSESQQGDNLSVNASANYHFNDDHRVNMTLGYIDKDSHSEGVTNGTKSISQSRRKNYSGVLEYAGQTEDHMFSLATTYNRSEQIAMTTTGKEYHFTTYGLDGKDTWFINDYNTLTFGFDVLREEMVHSAVAPAHINRVGLYLQDEISLFDEKLFLVPSLRYDHDSQFGGELTYQFGVTYEFLPDHRLKANIGTSYISPNLVQAYGYETRGNNAEVYGNPDLKPETGFSWEVRYEGKWNNISGSIGYYRSELKDQISSVQIGTNALGGTISQSINLAKSRLQGVEAELDIRFLENFVLSLGYNWIDNEDLINKQRAAYYATNSYSVGLLYNNPDWDFTANVWGNYYQDFTTTSGGMSNGSKYDSLGNPYVYDYYNVNASVSKTWKDKYTATLSGYNLITTSRDSTNDGSVSPFEVRLGLSIKF